MRHIEQLTRYVGNFVDELACQGVEHAVISPGSRSTPLAMMITEHKKIKEWILVDERSASFFALGLARATNKAVVLVCTSGTAAANYFPAVIEAYEQRIPLIVLTADRPHELRDTGASQTMNQIHLYGNFVKWFHEMALPDDSEAMLRYTRAKAARAYTESTHFQNVGPVQLNFPFREPLVPDFSLANVWGNEQRRQAFIQTIHGEKGLQQEALEKVASLLHTKKRGVIVCGPQFDESLGASITALSETLQVPILADPLSQIRAFTHGKENVIDRFDTILFTEDVRKQLAPDYIIRFGAMPISKRYLHYVNEHPDILHIVVENDRGVREPTNRNVTFVYADGKALCDGLRENIFIQHTENDWLAKWKQLNTIAAKHLNGAMNDRLTEGEAVRILLENMPTNSGLFAGNSMPIRDIDTFFGNANKALKLYGNRGVSGIEGITSTALGIAASKVHEQMTLVVGDLSFYHDINGLFASKKYQIPLTILLINNDGGGIFSFLPQANGAKHFEKLFGTPMGLDFANVAALYHAEYTVATTADTLRDALKVSYENKQLNIIEVQTDRTENVRWHQAIWSDIHEELKTSWDK